MEQLEQCNCRLQSDPPLERPSETGRKRLASAPPAIDVTRQAVQTKKARVQQEKPDLENKKKMAFETWVLESLLELKEMMQKGVNKPQEDVSQVENEVQQEEPSSDSLQHSECKMITFEQHEKELAVLQSRIKEKDKEINRQNQEIITMGIEKMQNQHPATMIQGPDDSSVSQAFDTLLYAIRNLVETEFKGKPLLKPVKKDHKSLFEQMANTQEDYEFYLTNPGIKKYFFESFIWRMLNLHLIKTPTKVFTITGESIFPPLLDDLDETIFPTWRAYTANIFYNTLQGYSQNWRPGGSSREFLVDRIVDHLIRYHSSGCKDELEQDIDNIVEKALQLACIMAKSRAFWTLALHEVQDLSIYGVKNRKGHRTCGFHPKICHSHVYNTLKWVDGGGHREGEVDLVVRPALLKFGNCSGQDYDVCRVVKKMEVIKISNE